MFACCLRRLLAFFLLLAPAPPCWAKTPPETIAARVDRLLAEELGHSPGELAPRCDDATFLRRAYLDLLGDIPTPEHLTAFLLDPSEGKRATVVRALLNEPQYGQNWARYWRDVILYRRLEDRSLLVAAALVPQLTEQINDGRGWDEIAAGFITAAGDIRENGATAIIAAQDGLTEEVAAEVSRIFLGIQIQCAQCHDHPWDSWEREQFHEFAAFFPRVSLQPVRSPVRRSLEVAVTDGVDRRPRPNANNRRGATEHYMPNMEDPQAPGTRMRAKFFLTGAMAPVGSRDEHRRGKASEWITESPWFAKAMVNRMWAELVGEPFFDTIDDIGPEREPKAPQALEALSTGFADSGYDLKWLMRTIMVTDAYQRECRPRRTPEATPMTANVAQRLRGDQLYNALLTSLGIEEQAEDNRGGYGRRRVGQRDQFNAAFGFDPSVDREAVAASIPQALAMMNTPRFNNAVRARRGMMLGELAEQIPADDALVDELYLRCLSREPTADERDAALAFRRSVDSRETAFEDLLWALVNSAEFAHRR